jgi:mono/diheme cytochrome c family protein
VEQKPMKKSIYVIATLLLIIGGLGWSVLASESSSADAESKDAGNSTAPVGEEDAAAETEEDLFAQLMEEGEQVYEEVCAECHGPEGGGQVGPPLRQNVENARGVVRAIVGGRGNMPPIAWDFPDEKVAAVVTYVRNSWGNEYGLVTEEEVAEFRP